MPLQTSGQVGPQVLGDGNSSPIRQTRDGSLTVAESHGRYYEAAYRKNVFTAIAQGTTLTALNTTATGLIVLNPYGSTKNLVLQKTGGFVAVTSASATGVILGYFAQGTSAFTNTTPITIASNFLSQLSSGSVAVASSSCSGIPAAPLALKNLLHNTAAIATTGEDPGWQVDLEGSIIVPPAFGIVLAATGAASAASALYADISWEEVPV